MSQLSDQKYLLKIQYKNEKNLIARRKLHSAFSTNKYDFHRWIFDHFNLPKDATILELGCGTGSIWLENKDRIPKGWKLTLTDFSSGMVKVTQNNLNKLTINPQYKIVDAQSIPFKDKSFDAVIANHMLYHVPDRKKAISEIKRVLKNGGYLYASTTGRDHMRELDELVNEFNHGFLWDKSSAENFILENGKKQLQKYFSKVKEFKFNNSLEVTEAEPLIQYVLSTKSGYKSVYKELDEFRKFVNDKIKKSKKFHITKSVGLFTAYE